MIVKIVDNGWGPEFALKRLQEKILGQYFATLVNDVKRYFVIDSTWYTDQIHEQVIADIKFEKPDVVILVSLLDPAVIQREWFADETQIWCVGYYTGLHEIDFWAVVMQHYFKIDFAVDRHKRIDTPFMCLNRKPHRHRQWFYRELCQHNLVDQGIVTLGGNTGTATRALENDVAGSDLAVNGGADCFGIHNDIMSLGRESNWSRCFLNIVTETVFDVDQAWFVSEKIYKPVLGQRPFLVVAPGGAEQWLIKHGFQTYIDDWKELVDVDLRDPRNIPILLQELCRRDANWLRQKYLALRSKIMYNLERFYQHVDEVNQRIEKGIICPI